MKMLKNALLFCLIIALGAGGLFSWRFASNRERILPMPYYFTFVPNKADIKSAENAKILVVGDKMAKALTPYLKPIDESVAPFFRRTNVIYNWGEPHESLARTIYKLKNLNKFPPLIIYHGASEEFYEDRFNLKDRQTILKNFSTYDNDTYLSLMITFPFLSKAFYKKETEFTLGPRPLKSSYEFAEGDRIIQKEILYTLFQHEFRELIELIKTNGSSLITITNPINREIAPKEVCSEVNTNTVIEYQQEAYDMLKNGNTKSAYTKLKELESVISGNAQVYFLLGKAALLSGEKTDAINYFNQAASFDCNPQNGDPIFNQIIISESKKQSFAVVDFDFLNTSVLGSESFFLDNFYPHHLFYEKMQTELLATTRKTLNIK